MISRDECDLRRRRARRARAGPSPRPRRAPAARSVGARPSRAAERGARRREIRVRERAQQEPPAAGADRRQEPLRGVADDQEDRARRRLLDHLEQGVGAGDASDPRRCRRCRRGSRRRPPSSRTGRARGGRRRRGSWSTRPCCRSPAGRRSTARFGMRQGRDLARGGWRVDGDDRGLEPVRPAEGRAGSGRPGRPGSPCRCPRGPPISQAWCRRPRRIAVEEGALRLVMTEEHRLLARMRGARQPVRLRRPRRGSARHAAGSVGPPQAPAARSATASRSPPRPRPARASASITTQRSGSPAAISQEGLPQALVEGGVLRLEAVGALALRAPPRRGAAQADRGRQVEDERQVGLASSPTTTRSRASSSSGSSSPRAP